MIRFTIADLAARETIRKLVLLYSRAIDRKDYDLARSLYAADATDTHGRDLSADEWTGHSAAMVASPDRCRRPDAG